MDDFDALLEPPNLSEFAIPEPTPFISHFKDTATQQVSRKEPRSRKRLKLSANSREDDPNTSSKTHVRRKRMHQHKINATETHVDAAHEKPAKKKSAKQKDLLHPVRFRKHQQQQLVDEKKTQLALNKVVPFYQKNPGVIGSVIVPITSRQSPICLRFLSWVVRSYSQKQNVAYFLDEIGTIFEDDPGPRHKYKYMQVKLWKAFERALRKYGKEAFAPSRRRERVKLQFDTTAQLIGQPPQMDFVTSLCQLNFFRWAWVVGALAYCWKFYDKLHPLWLEVRRLEGKSNKHVSTKNC
jgi:hypothetical protein